MPSLMKSKCNRCGLEWPQSVLTDEEVRRGITGYRIMCLECGSVDVLLTRPFITVIKGNRRKFYNLFISHSWTYGDHYDKLINLLNKGKYFKFKDYSVPKDDPIDNIYNDAALREAIRKQMFPCSVILVMAGVYSTYSRWIDEEIGLAQSGFKNPKPILAIKPWGNTNMSTTVTSAADAIVNWNTESIVKAIRKLAK